MRKILTLLILFCAAVALAQTPMPNGFRLGTGVTENTTADSIRVVTINEYGISKSIAKDTLVSWLGISGVGGTNGQMQYNNNGSFAGYSGIVVDGSDFYGFAPYFDLGATDEYRIYQNWIESGYYHSTLINAYTNNLSIQASAQHPFGEGGSTSGVNLTTNSANLTHINIATDTPVLLTLGDGFSAYNHNLDGETNLKALIYDIDTKSILLDDVGGGTPTLNSIIQENNVVDTWSEIVVSDEEESYFLITTEKDGAQSQIEMFAGNDRGNDESLIYLKVDGDSGAKTFTISSLDGFSGTYTVPEADGSFIQKKYLDDNYTPIKSKRISVSATSLRNCGTTPVTLIDGLGSGVVINVLSVSAFYEFSGGANNFGEDLVIRVGNNPSYIIDKAALNGSGDNYIIAHPNGQTVSSADNEDVVLTGSDSSAGVGATSTLTLIINYTVDNYNE